MSDAEQSPPGAAQSLGRGVESTSYSAMAAEHGPLVPYIVELHFSGEPGLDPEALVTEIAARYEAKPTVAQVADGAYSLTFDEVGADGSSIAFVNVVQRPVDDASRVAESALDTTSDWEEAESVLAASTTRVLIADSFAARLDRADRFRIFHAVVASAVATLEPAAINWLPAQRIVRPAQYLDAFGDPAAEFEIMVNMRLFRVDAVARTSVMDSIGMRHFGLPDVQMVFDGLEPADVAPWLKSCAFYLFGNGDIIEDGNWVDGLVGDERFYCQHEVSVAGPTREVLNIDAGRYRSWGRT